jgi:AmmeMemoRadiSam system protein A
MSSRPLGDEEKRFLLRLARTTLEEHFAGHAQAPEAPPEGGLTERRGAFVTLTVAGELRGCIGHVVGVAPLWQSVRQNALAAALKDPRFSPVTAAELGRIAIEISAMSPLREIASADQVEVGRHGLVLQNGPYRGLLLPQVATDHGWDRETFLRHTCRKAGLGPDSWKDPETRIAVFEAEVFSEEEMGLGPAVPAGIRH